MASITKSDGTMVKRTIVGSPTSGTSANRRGWRSSHCSRKYGPSNFCVSPVRESPTTIAGRYTDVGMPPSRAAATSTSARNFVSS
jgi:hypothetical protein